MFDILVHPALISPWPRTCSTHRKSPSTASSTPAPSYPDQIWTLTPWHQDAQYYRDAEAGPRNLDLDAPAACYRTQQLPSGRARPAPRPASRRLERPRDRFPWPRARSARESQRRLNRDGTRRRPLLHPNHARTALSPTAPTRSAGPSTSATNPPPKPPKQVRSRVSSPTVPQIPTPFPLSRNG